MIDMITYSTDTADLLFVGVPEGIYRAEIQGGNLLFYSWQNEKYPGLPDSNIHISIPSGYSLLSAGTADGVSDEDAGKVVEVVYKDHPYHPDAFIDYLSGKSKHWTSTAISSLHSLLRSLNLNPSETVVLYKLKN